MQQVVSATLLFAFFLVTGCGGTAANEEDLATRYERPDGVVEVNYSRLPADRTVTATADLTIGSEDLGDEYILGDVRGIEPAADGTIYVFDHQASEIRAFDSSGDYLRTVAGPGQGPGEIAEANGMELVGDSVLWVHDHRKWRMTGIDTHGGEVGVYELPIKSYGYIFSGLIDSRGRYWKTFSKSDQPRQGRPDPGYQESGYDSYYLSYDYRTGERDSLYLGHATRGSVVASRGNGWGIYGIPFQSRQTVIVDPGGGFWHARKGEYRLSRLNASADTVLVIDVGMDALPVTDVDRDAMRERVGPDDPVALAAIETVISHMPDEKPLISDMVVDDEGRLWVSRVVEPDADPLYDVFTEEGEFLGSVRIAFQVNEYFPIRVRNDRIYTLGEDDIGAPIVIRSAPIDFRAPTAQIADAS